MTNEQSHEMALLFNKEDISKYTQSELGYIFEQYRIMIESTDKISDKRATANQFFLSVITFLVSIIGIVTGFGNQEMWIFGGWIIFLSLTGIILTLFWYRILESYQQLNKRKFVIIHMIEKHLPLRLFDFEWKILGEGKNPKTYHPLTQLEKWVPLLFIMLFMILMIFGMGLIYDCAN